MKVRVDQANPGAVQQMGDMAARVIQMEASCQALRRQLDEANRQLFQANKVSVAGQMVATVAHDLNNPLNGVLGYAQLLMKRTNDPSLVSGLQKTEGEAQRAAQIVQTLLQFVRDHKPERRPTQVNTVIVDVMALRAHHQMINQVAMALNLDAGVPLVIGDAHLIGQAILNLVINAERAIASTSARGVIRISSGLASDGSQPVVRIKLRDTGPGIPPDNLKRIFEPFFTTKPSGQGTGLGLSICRQIVAEHRGTLTVDSQPGVGTTFTLNLPVMDGNRWSLLVVWNWLKPRRMCHRPEAWLLTMSSWCGSLWTRRLHPKVIGSMPLPAAKRLLRH